MDHKLAFAFIREDVLASHLKPADKVVWGGLMMFWMQKNDCWPTQETLSQATGLSRKCINKSLSRLEEAGYIETKRRRYVVVYKKGKAYQDGDSSDWPSKMLPTVTSKDNQDVTNGYISPPQMLPTVTPDVTNGYTEVYQEVHHKEEVNHNTHMSEVPDGTPDERVSPKPKSNGQAKKLPAWLASPHRNEIDALLTWFQSNHPNPARQTPALRDKAGEVLDKLLRIDLAADPDAPGVVRRVVEWAVQDTEGQGNWQGWQSNLRSLAALRDRSKNGCTKFENIRNAYERQERLQAQAEQESLTMQESIAHIQKMRQQYGSPTRRMI